MDISFKMGDEKFNYRVSAIIISNGRILAMSHDKPSEYYSLPGGRVMMEENGEPEKTPVEKVKENIDRRDAEGDGMSPEDIIAEQKADLDTLLQEIDKMQAQSDMNGDEGEDAGEKEETAPTDENTDSDDEGAGAECDPEKQKGVNMDSVDKIIQDRLDVCRMADRLNLDGVEGLSVREGRNVSPARRP